MKGKQLDWVGYSISGEGILPMKEKISVILKVLNLAKEPKENCKLIKKITTI